MKTFVKILFLGLLAFTFQPDVMQAQTIKVEKFPATTAVDSTLTNAETITYTSAALNKGIASEVTWQVFGDSVSGSTNATAYVEESACQSCSDWVSVTGGTMVIDGVTTAKQYKLSPSALRTRLRIVSTGTQVTRVRAKCVSKY